MHVFQEILSLRKQVSEWKQAGLKVGFVPTMGNLHSGHLSLVELAQQSCDKVVVSIFVNPKQFGPNEDFDSYPRTFESDEQQLKEISADAVFYPAVGEIYPKGTHQTIVRVPDELTGLLEGAKRPGHFDGVTTVVAKLFNIVQPHLAVFGQKDYQQLAVIQAMVNDLAMPIEIVTAPIARDVDGLALSSRNQYLDKQQRQVAPKLNTVLQDIEKAIVSGNQDYPSLCSTATEILGQEGFDSVDYIQICQAESLLPAQASDTKLVILAVARLGQTRLLDNILLSLKS